VLLHSSSCTHAIATAPAELLDACSLTSPAVTAFPVILAGRLLHLYFRGLLSVHSRYGLRTRQVTCVTLYTEGFSCFVTSTTAPITTGWSDSCRVGFAPTGRACLSTARRIVTIKEVELNRFALGQLR
jgi:hypothetical protein